MSLTNKIIKTGIVLGIAANLTACDVTPGFEKSSGTDYNRVVEMPKDCEKVLSAGSAIGFHYDVTNLDWLSCEDSKGNVTIYRMPKSQNTWYKTEIKR